MPGVLYVDSSADFFATKFLNFYRYRVVESFVLFLYTHVIFDCHGKDESALVSTSSFKDPEFSFSIMELYMLADYFDVPDLTR